jgi:(E)-4-hydroxy-3-methylbut-2-enyl-diphosphate synthase
VIDNTGGHHVPVVVADLSKAGDITPEALQRVGYSYDEILDKWNIGDQAADYIYIENGALGFALPGTLKVILPADQWKDCRDKEKYFPIYRLKEYTNTQVENKSKAINFVMIDCYSQGAVADENEIAMLKNDHSAILCLSSTNTNAMQSVRRMFMTLESLGVRNPAILITDSNKTTPDEHLIHFATETGALLLDGFGDGICLGMTDAAYSGSYAQLNASGRNYINNKSVEQFINSTAFSILQATRTRISKTEYISCPSCGRTLFDLQETTAKIRAVTHHLKGVKIAIMGCIVNGPGEMADADFGYVGSGPGKITLYKGKEVVKRSVSSDIAVEELINLLKENDAWVEP